MIKTIPEGYQTVTPMLIVKDARKAIDFYQRAFGAVARLVMPNPDGQGVMHVELQVGSSIIMMGEEHPQEACKSAETLGSSPVSFYVYLDDVDEAYRKALDAGVTVNMPLEEMFWGDRAGTVQDPFGYSWTLATHVKDLTPEEIRKGAEAFFARMKSS
jgi:uncharacterized glyoxalase superfamily protein PhnB